MTKRRPFCYSKTSPETTRLAVMLYVRFPLSRLEVVELLLERGINISHEPIRFCWNQFDQFRQTDANAIATMQGFSNS